VHAAVAFDIEVAHATALPHWPFEPHVSSELPEHWVAPGVQTPAQALPRQT
jgi:hypothetical protein